MACQLRIYTMKPGQLDNWVTLYERAIVPLRRSHGFALEAWVARASDQFVWLVRRTGSVEEFTAADEAYYALPAHRPLHEEALGYIETTESWFLDPLDPGRK